MNNVTTRMSLPNVSGGDGYDCSKIRETTRHGNSFHPEIQDEKRSELSNPQQKCKAAKVTNIWTENSIGKCNNTEACLTT
jgi:hypothetical protein